MKEKRHSVAKGDFGFLAQGMDRWQWLLLKGPKGVTNLEEI